MAFRLYTYWRSSAAFRVRIALALKGLEYESVPKHLLRDGGEQRKPDYLAVNPQGLIPALADDGFVIPQSLAICEYLEEIHPEPRLLPGSARDRAIVRGMAMVVACDTHPLNNLPIMGYLRREFGADDATVNRWVAHWIDRGFSALERWVGSMPGAPAVVGAQRFCFGDTPTLADVCLVPQMYNARRFSVDVTPYPRLVAICAHLERLPAFAAARPENQPDAEGK
jgi:maleylacetoacetate isomerase